MKIHLRIEISTWMFPCASYLSHSAEHFYFVFDGKYEKPEMIQMTSRKNESKQTNRKKTIIIYITNEFE